MANAATLLDLRTRAQRHADLENSAFLSDPEWNSLINLGGSELHDLLVATNEDYVVKTMTPFTPTAGQSSYALPDDTLKLLQVDNLLGGTYRRQIKRVMAAEHTFGQGVGQGFCQGYRQFGQTIEFLPGPPQSGTVEIRYAPQYTLLAADGAVVNAAIPVGWEEYMPLWAAVRAMSKQRVDNSLVVSMLTDLRDRIKHSAPQRDVNQVARVADVTGRFGGIDEMFGPYADFPAFR